MKGLNRIIGICLMALGSIILLVSFLPLSVIVSLEAVILVLFGYIYFSC